MASSKTNLFDPSLNSMAGLFKAMAHPARLAILKYLAESKICMTGDIADELPLSRTTVKQHLTELKNAGLIQGTVEGVKVNYCLDPGKICDFGRMFLEFYKIIEQPADHHCKETS